MSTSRAYSQRLTFQIAASVHIVSSLPTLIGSSGRPFCVRAQRLDMLWKGMTEKPPTESADHAEDFSKRWCDRLEEYCTLRMDELGIHRDLNGEPNYAGDGRWWAFNPSVRSGGNTISGIVVDSGALNPELLKGRKGGRLWREARLRDRIDAIIAHEYEESRCSDHSRALKAAAKTQLPITEGARRICRAMAR